MFCSVWEGTSTPTLIVLVYRPPDVSIRSDRQLIELLRSTSSNFSHKAVIGDWNADILTPDDSDTRFLTNIMTELSMKLINTGPSHHTTKRTKINNSVQTNTDELTYTQLTDNDVTLYNMDLPTNDEQFDNIKDTWIDSIFVDECDSIISHNRLQPPFPNRHDIITATIDIFYPLTSIESHTYKSINKVTSKDLNSYLCEQDWSIFSTGKYNAEQGLTQLTENLQKAINTLAPDKTINPKKSLYPWIDTDIKLLISKRDSTRRHYERTGSRQLYDEYLSLANLVEKKSEIARCAYMHNRICNSLDTNKNFWSEMRKLGLLPKPSDALHGFLPEELNTYFSGISFSSSEVPTISLNQISSASPDGFSFKQVTENDVILAVSHFQSQAKDEDGIPQSIVAKALPTIAKYLTILFNESLKNGNFPEAWKISRILALKKVSIPSCPSDFRPVALLCFLSKVLEKLAHDQVVSFLTKSKILDIFQAGFRKHHSTQTALLKLTDDIRLAKENKLAICLISPRPSIMYPHPDY